MAPAPIVAHHSVIIVGGGQAGLSISWYLKHRGIDHVVFEKHRAGHAWRAERWDTFCLVTPNWQCQLPGYPYAGADPHGFMLREEIVDYLDGFVASFDPPLVRRRVGDGLAQPRPARLRARDQRRPLRGRSGGDRDRRLSDPGHPALAERLPADIVQTQLGRPIAIRNQLPDGAVLVVGSGQSGAQIAEDLHLAGRKVHLCVGDAPRVARRYRGKDVVEWLHLMGYYDLPVHEHPLREGVRDKTNHYVTGRDGGRDIDLRQRAREGMELYGRLLDVTGDTLAVRRRSRALPRPGRPGLGKHQDQHRHVHRQAGDRRAAGGALSTGMGAAAGAADARLSRGRHHQHRLVHRLSRRLQLDRPAGVQRPRPTRACARRHRRARTSISSDCRGSTPGARGVSPASPATPSMLPIRSRPGSTTPPASDASP